MDSDATKKVIKGFLSGSGKGYSSSILKKLKVEELSEEKVECSFVVTEDVSNPFGSLHGGCIATLADDITTAAIMMVDLDHRPGVSISIHTEYFLPANVGQKVVIVARVLKTGKSIAFCECKFYNEEGKLLANVQHSKYLMSSKA